MLTTLVLLVLTQVFKQTFQSYLFRNKAQRYGTWGFPGGPVTTGLGALTARAQVPSLAKIPQALQPGRKKKAKQNLVLAVTLSAPLPRLCCPCCTIGSPHPCYQRGRFKNLALRRTKEGKSLSSVHFLLIYFNTGTNPALTYS